MQVDTMLALVWEIRTATLDGDISLGSPLTPPPPPLPPSPPGSGRPRGSAVRRRATRPTCRTGRPASSASWTRSAAIS